MVRGWPQIQVGDGRLAPKTGGTWEVDTCHTPSGSELVVFMTWLGLATCDMCHEP